MLLTKWLDCGKRVIRKISNAGSWASYGPYHCLELPNQGIKTYTWNEESIQPRSHLADLKADLSRPWWSGEVLWSRGEVGKERVWVLEGPERSLNLVEVSPTVPDCFELFKGSRVVGNEEQAWIEH